jgi:hypothetical protein
MGATIRFYATREDLLRVLRDVEQAQELAYVRTGDCEGPDPNLYHQADQLDGLGISHTGEMLREPSYFILPSKVQIQVDPIPRSVGGVRYYVGARLNTDAINLISGGTFTELAIVEGQLRLFTDSKLAMEVFRLCKSAMRKRFNRYGGILIGHHALDLHRGGRRLVQSIKSPPEWDIRVEPE